MDDVGDNHDRTLLRESDENKENRIPKGPYVEGIPSTHFHRQRHSKKQNAERSKFDQQQKRSVAPSTFDSNGTKARTAGWPNLALDADTTAFTTRPQQVKQVRCPTSHPHLLKLIGSYYNRAQWRVSQLVVLELSSMKGLASFRRKLSAKDWDWGLTKRVRSQELLVLTVTPMSSN